MGVSSTIILLLRSILDSIIAAIPLSVILYFVTAVLPSPESFSRKFVVGGVYVLAFVFLWHFAYYFSQALCPALPEVPGFFTECSFPNLGDILAASIFATLVPAPYILLFYSAAFVTYHRLNIKSRFARIYLASLVFILVMLLWVAVFPWSLERYLQLFY